MLAIGRLIEQKDHATLLEAFARVRATIPRRGSRSSAGDRSRRRRSDASHELGLADAVLVPGRVEPRDWLARADVFVHTSRWEGFGIVLLEAMLASLPVVATSRQRDPRDRRRRRDRAARPGRRRERARRGTCRRSLDDPARRGRSASAGLRARPRASSRSRGWPSARWPSTSGPSHEGDLAPRADARRAAEPDRIALLSIWFKGHNNPRYAELLPRLERLDACLLRLPDARIPRGLGFRAFAATKPLLSGGARRDAAQRYASLLSLDFEQLDRWPGATVMDADDPFFTAARGRAAPKPSTCGPTSSPPRAPRGATRRSASTSRGS